jgi:hypothetical protein
MVFFIPFQYEKQMLRLFLCVCVLALLEVLSGVGATVITKSHSAKTRSHSKSHHSHSKSHFSPSASECYVPPQYYVDFLDASFANMSIIYPPLGYSYDTLNSSDVILGGMCSDEAQLSFPQNSFCDQISINIFTDQNYYCALTTSFSHNFDAVLSEFHVGQSNDAFSAVNVIIANYIINRIPYWQSLGFTSNDVQTAIWNILDYPGAVDPQTPANAVHVQTILNISNTTAGRSYVPHAPTDVILLIWIPINASGWNNAQIQMTPIPIYEFNSCHGCPFETASNSLSTSHASVSHQSLSQSDSHSDSTSHQSESLSTSHQSESLSTSHDSQSDSKSHESESLSTSHDSQSLSTSHESESLSNSHQSHSDSKSHHSQSLSASLFPCAPNACELNDSGAWPLWIGTSASHLSIFPQCLYPREVIFNTYSYCHSDVPVPMPLGVEDDVRFTTLWDVDPVTGNYQIFSMPVPVHAFTALSVEVVAKVSPPGSDVISDLTVMLSYLYQSGDCDWYNPQDNQIPCNDETPYNYVICTLVNATDGCVGFVNQSLGTEIRNRFYCPLPTLSEGTYSLEVAALHANVDPTQSQIFIDRIQGVYGGANSTNASNIPLLGLSPECLGFSICSGCTTSYNYYYSNSVSHRSNSKSHHSESQSASESRSPSQSPSDSKSHRSDSRSKSHHSHSDSKSHRSHSHSKSHESHSASKSHHSDSHSKSHRSH